MSSEEGSTYRYKTEKGDDEFKKSQEAAIEKEAKAAASKEPSVYDELRAEADAVDAGVKLPEEPEGGRRRSSRRTRKVRILIKNKGDLVKVGYSLGKSARSRHTSLKKAVKRYGRLSTSRKLNALAVFNKRRHPATARKARADRKFVMKE
jgi:hypothetical protein